MKLTDILNEVLYSAEFKKWMKDNVTVRGMHEPYKDNTNVYGKGIYSCELKDIEIAKQYGEINWVLNARPENPKVFKNQSDCWKWMADVLWSVIKNTKETITSGMIKLGFDGMIIGGFGMVKYKPKNVKFFKTIDDLYDYWLEKYRGR